MKTRLFIVGLALAAGLSVPGTAGTLTFLALSVGGNVVLRG